MPTQTVEFPINETFTNGTTNNPNWVFKDAQLNGSLVLTPDEHHRAGTAVLNEPFSSRHDVTVGFDFAIRGGTDPVGDGFIVYLIDGTSEPELTLNGPGLGYALSDGGQAGVSHGYVGIALDNWGYYAQPTGRNDGDGAGAGGPGMTPGMLGIRGSGQGTTGFQWLTGTKLPERFTTNDRIKVDWDDQARLQIAIVEGRITVRLSTKDDPNGTVLIDAFDLSTAPGQAPLPDTLKIGFAAGTGTYTAAHEIRNLRVTMPVDMPLEITGPAQAEAGSKVCYPITVRNDGPNNAPDAVVVIDLPPQLTNVTVQTQTAGGADKSDATVTAGTAQQKLNLPKNGTATVTVCGTIEPTYTGKLTIPATITSPTCSNTSPRQNGEATTTVNEHQKPPAEQDLVVKQEIGIEDGPGGLGTSVNITVTGREQGRPVDPGLIKHVFTAPTGFRWNGHVGAQYKRLDMTTAGSTPEVQAQVSEDGRTLTFTYNPHVFTGDDDRDLLVYICGIEAAPDATPGRYTDGKAEVGHAPVAKIKGTVLGPND
ncbi:hypothetical protein ACFYPB_40325 [Streptomyces olivaceoviridis]|uniref:lectin-like domain-containing protein n=1 Tax=Streptomyces olivaceoviridis TaxID=1921 RepID=UPI0036AB0CDA